MRGSAHRDASTCTRTTCRCATATSTRRAATSTARACSCARRDAPQAPCDRRDRRADHAARRALARRHDARRATARAPWGFGRYRAASYDELIDHPVEMADVPHVARSTAGGVAHDVAVTGRARVDARPARARPRAHLPMAVRPVRRRDRARARRSTATCSRSPRSATATAASSTARARASCAARRPARAAASRQVDRRLPGLPRPRQPRVLPQLERQAHQAGGVRPLRPRARGLHAPAVGVRGHHVVLRRPRAGAQRRHRRRELRSSSLGRTDHERAAHAGTARCRAWPTRASTRGSSTTGPTRTRPTPASATTRRARWSRSRSTSRCAITRSSLDAVMRELWRRHGQTGIGVPEDGLRRSPRSSRAATSRRFFDALRRRAPTSCRSPGSWPTHGIALALRAAEGAKDRGGKRGNGERRARGDRRHGRPDLRLQHVYAGGPAEGAGLAAGDTLVALDGLKATAGAPRRAMRATRSPATASPCTRSAATS